MISELLKPHEAAISLTASAVCSSCRRAASTRKRSANLAGVMPVSFLKTRLKFRGLIAARLASTSTERFLFRFSAIHRPRVPSLTARRTSGRTVYGLMCCFSATSLVFPQSLRRGFADIGVHSYRRALGPAPVLGPPPLVARTAIRIPHAFDVNRGVRVNLTRSVNSFRLRIPDVACSLRTGTPDGVVALFPLFDVQFLL